MRLLCDRPAEARRVPLPFAMQCVKDVVLLRALEDQACSPCHAAFMLNVPIFCPPFATQYVKDVVLPRALDDQTFSTLCSLILFNNVDVSRFRLPVTQLARRCCGAL